MKNTQTARLFIFLVSIVFFISSCKKSDDNNPGTPATPGKNEIWMQGSAFNPVTLTVPVNTIVKWINKDSYAHTVTSESTLFNSGELASNATFSFQFTATGTFKYHCSIHSMMTGTIIVQ
jgi:plastocyanin